MGELWTLDKAVDRNAFFREFQRLCGAHGVSHATVEVMLQGDYRTYRQKVSHGSNLGKAGQVVNIWFSEVRCEVAHPMHHISDASPDPHVPDPYGDASYHVDYTPEKD